VPQMQKERAALAADGNLRQAAPSTVPEDRKEFLPHDATSSYDDVNSIALCNVRNSGQFIA
jgi:hypothetical protein